VHPRLLPSSRPSRLHIPGTEPLPPSVLRALLTHHHRLRRLRQNPVQPTSRWLPLDAAGMPLWYAPPLLPIAIVGDAAGSPLVAPGLSKGSQAAAPAAGAAREAALRFFADPHAHTCVTWHGAWEWE
jgi:hypothetical protein